ncbi:MAG TPA: DUF4010 domain-containing protein [Ignavibacteria bacterium]|jgi:uncharacterized membrane protein (DUF4010 family)
MFMDIFNRIPEIFFNFIITLLLSLLIGFEQRKRADQDIEEADERGVFGTDRTFAFIGTLGFILYILEPKSMIPFIAGLVITAIYFAIYYYQKIVQYKSYGTTSMIVGLITYTLGPLVITQPKWLTVLIAVSVLILVERKASFEKLSTKVDISEFFTLGKFLIIAAVVLPITPREPLMPYVNLSPYHIWFTVVAVSSISYISYILHKYVFPKSGLLISGVLGGLYSSTATTFILSRKAKALKPESNEYASSIIAATGMMYLRVLILMIVFNYAIFIFLLPYVTVLFLLSVVISGVVYYLNKPAGSRSEGQRTYNNPIELKIALLFAALFVIFSAVTNYVIQSYGTYGLDVLSYIIGFTDIDPFLLNLFQGNYPLGTNVIAKAVLQAIASNNILKAGYTFIIADKRTRKAACAGLLLITLLNIVFAMIV